MKLQITTLVFGDEDDMNVYHSLDQDPEPDPIKSSDGYIRR